MGFRSIRALFLGLPLAVALGGCSILGGGPAPPPTALPGELNAFLPCPSGAILAKPYPPSLGAEMDVMRKSGKFPTALQALDDYYNLRHPQG